jgi:hypothetical protein
MSALAVFSVSVAALLLTTVSCRAQLGATRQQLIGRYGPCKPDDMPKPKGPNVYDSVIDAGNHCYFYDGRIRGTAMFKSDRVVGFYFDKSPTFWESLFHPFAYSYLPLSDAEISTLLRSAAPGAEWVAGVSDDIVRRWHTPDGSAAAYYFAGGHRDRYELVVQTAAVDAIYRKVEHY